MCIGYIDTYMILVGGDWNMTWIFFQKQLGMSSSHLTFIFFRGVETTNQIIAEGDLEIYSILYRRLNIPHW